MTAVCMQRQADKGSADLTINRKVGYRLGVAPAVKAPQMAL